MKFNRAVLLLLLVFAALPLAAQTHFEMSESRIQNSPISYEAIPLVNSDSANLQIDLHYRIAENFFIFIRDESAAPKTQYVAHGELVVELVNDQKVSVARQIRQLPLSRPNLLRESDHTPSLQGVVPLSVPPGTYTIVFSVDDRESGRNFMEKTRKVTLLDPKSKSLQASGLMFYQAPTLGTTQQMFMPMNRGGNVLFGDAGGILTEVFQPSAADTLSLKWKIDGQTDGFGDRIEKIEGSAFTAYAGLLQLLPDERGVLYGVKSGAGSWKTVAIPLPLEKLEPGNYNLEIKYRSGSETKQQTHQFRVTWPSRPFSLTDPDLAIDALRYIATEPEIDAMQSGSSAKRADAFYRFWKDRSRDTTTAYNVALAEYYYRVDEAMRKFSTSRENDGYKTDRGRIYILYGPPPKFDRLLEPNSAPTEVWTYSELHRKFIFIDTDRNGNYVLSQVENL